MTHRYGVLGSSLARLLPSWRPGSYYPTTKLCNVMFAYELQRRLGGAAVQVS